MNRYMLFIGHTFFIPEGSKSCRGQYSTATELYYKIKEVCSTLNNVQDYFIEIYDCIKEQSIIIWRDRMSVPSLIEINNLIS